DTQNRPASAARAFCLICPQVQYTKSPPLCFPTFCPKIQGLRDELSLLYRFSRRKGRAFPPVGQIFPAARRGTHPAAVLRRRNAHDPAEQADKIPHIVKPGAQRNIEDL